MNLFKKLFGSNNPSEDEGTNDNPNKPNPDINSPLDEQFIYNFKKNGGKFLYCENLNEVKEQKSNSIMLKNTKEEIAALLAIPRPSLSRELINLRNYYASEDKKLRERYRNIPSMK